MKILPLASGALVAAAVLVFHTPVRAQADAASEGALARTYADIAFQTYSDAATAAVVTSEAAATLKREPNPLALAFAKMSWVETRAPFMQAEIFRFAGGPIDAGENPAVARLNGHVLPEFIEGTATSILEDKASYPVIDAKLLVSLHQKDKAENVALGFHALEFLLWGPDNNPEGPGSRDSSDFAADNPLGGRRADYALACATLLAEQLEELAKAWSPDVPGNYRESFLKLSDEVVTARILNSAVTLAKVEVAGKRLRAPLEAKDGGAEESPFSDITHVDVMHATGGIANVMAGAYLGGRANPGIRVKGTGIIAIVEKKDPALATALKDAVNVAIMAVRAPRISLEKAMAADASDPAGKTFGASIDALETLAETTSKAAAALGVALDAPSE